MAMGVKQMAKHKVIVKRLAALEALGSVTNICSDKTGTLTQAKMTAAQMWLPSNLSYTITGTGLIPDGDFKNNATGEELDKDVSSLSAPMQHFFLCSVLCNTAAIVYSEDSPYSVDSKGRGIKAIGEPTEVALAVMAAKLGLSKSSLLGNEYKVWKTNEFTSSLKKMSVLTSHNHKRTIYMKGAPERVLDSCSHYMASEFEEPCTIDKKFIGKVTKQNMMLAEQGLVRALTTWFLPTLALCVLTRFATTQRVLALAYQSDLSYSRKTAKQLNRETMERDLIFLGLVGIYDPPRPETRRAVMTCANAGVTVHMATGDQPPTAVAIAKQVNILSKDDPGVNGGRAMAAIDFDKMEDDDVDKLDDLPAVLARCSPDSKVCFQSNFFSMPLPTQNRVNLCLFASTMIGQIGQGSASPRKICCNDRRWSQRCSRFAQGGCWNCHGTIRKRCYS
jgi:magnesium-transporting ATPase (P-type)